MGKKSSIDRHFHFKPFSLSHSKSTMRVGTDAILMGLFASIPKINKTLEIGTGCGIISLIIATKSYTQIEAIDIDRDSVEEAKKNFSNSPFYQRLKAIHADFNEFAKSHTGKYDLIVSNPPFFINDFRPADYKKKTARHSDLLTYQQICDGTVCLLNSSGKLCLVLPYDESRTFLEIASQKGLYLQRQQLIFPGRGLQPNRINLQFGFEKIDEIQTEKLTIREEDGTFTPEYIDLLKDYYIALK